MNSRNNSYPGIGQSIGILGIVFFGMLFFSPIIFAGLLIGEELAMFIYYVFAVGIPFWIIHIIRKTFTGTTSYNLSIGNRAIIPFLLIATIGIQYGLTLPISSLIPMPDWVKEMFNEAFGNPRNIFVFLSVVVAAPVLEEFIFRGIMLEGLLKRYSPQKAIIISSIFFGVIHFNPWQFITALLLGVFIGWIYYKTRSLTLAIMIHAFNNFIAILPMLLGYSTDTLDKSLRETFGGNINLIIVIIISLSLLYVSIIEIAKRFKTTEESSENTHEEGSY